MHDLRLLREQPELLREAMRRRGALDALAPRLDHANALEQQRRALIQQVEERKARRNQTSQEVARLRKAGGDADEGDEGIAGDRERNEPAAEILERTRFTMERERLAVG